MDRNSTEISLPARHDSLVPLLDWLALQAALAGVSEADARRLRLVLEELFVNTVDHGFAGGGEGMVSVALAATPGGAQLRYGDEGPPFDPTDRAPAVSDGVRPGGFGLGLARGLAEAMRYRREAGRNILEVDFRFPAKDCLTGRRDG